MRPILQAQAAECSLACLAMISSAHGKNVGLHDLRQQFPVSIKGANLRQLIADAGRLGFSARPLRLEMNELNALSLPCILHWDLNHFVVLKKVGRSKIALIDPAIGERLVSREEVSRHFTGVALELSPNGEFSSTEATPRISLRQLTGQVSGMRRALGAIFCVALVLELLAIASPLFNQMVVDNAIATRDLDLLNVLLIGFGLLLIAQTILVLARSWMVVVLSQNISLQWKGNVFGHLLKLPVDWFEKRHLGDITNRFGAIEAIQRTITSALVEVILDGIMVLTSLAMMLLYSVELSAIVVVAVVLYGLIRWISYEPLRAAAAERLVISAREQSYMIETLRAIVPLKLFGRQNERRVSWQNMVIEIQNRDLRTERMNIGFLSANKIIFGVENLLVFWLAARMILLHPMDGSSGSTSLTIGMVFAFVAYKSQFTGRVTAIIDYIVQIRMLSLHSERLADIALAAPERESISGDGIASDLSHLVPSLEFRDVSFRYGEGEPWILRNANLKIQPGQHVAIIGSSGAGKTTLLKLVLGMVQPVDGDILYGGVPINRLGLTNVRCRFGSVMQEDLLLTGSIADNISFFDPQSDALRIEMCAKMAQIHGDVIRMPMGYRTLVGELGAGLSGGQKQRLLLARAIYRQPSVLALDEATSHLDVEAEREVAKCLANMQLTRLVIAHRPETIASADRVVQIRDGVLCELPN